MRPLLRVDYVQFHWWGELRLDSAEGLQNRHGRADGTVVIFSQSCFRKAAKPQSPKERAVLLVDGLKKTTSEADSSSARAAAAQTLAN